MMIKSLLRDYVQKSRMFLYPLLGIKRGFSVTPKETYVCWKGLYKPEDCRFICIYYIREDSDFKLFEKSKLLSNRFFETTIELDDNQRAYVFDMSERKEDFLNFINGKYSRLSKEHKRTVMNFFKNNKKHYVYIESYLFPSKYFSMYAELLSTNKIDVESTYKILRKVGELCSPPDLKKESLKTNDKSLKFKENPLHLSSNPTKT